VETAVGVLGLLGCLVWVIRCGLGGRGRRRTAYGNPIGEVGIVVVIELVVALYRSQSSFCPPGLKWERERKESYGRLL
jgi:hypothetical protein